jgi:hypothetical protein
VLIVQPPSPVEEVVTTGGRTSGRTRVSLVSVSVVVSGVTEVSAVVSGLTEVSAVVSGSTEVSAVVSGFTVVSSAESGAVESAFVVSGSGEVSAVVASDESSTVPGGTAGWESQAPAEAKARRREAVR